MRLTPLDIREQQFKRVMRGLDAEEVAGFLDAVAREFEALVGENQELRVHVQQANEKLEDYLRMEKALRDTLIGAERIVADSRDTARKQADLVLREAELAAQQATARITGQIAALRQELLELRKARDAYASRLRWLLQSHLDGVNGLESNFADLDQRLFGGPGDIEAVVPRVESRLQVGVSDAPSAEPRPGAAPVADPAPVAGHDPGGSFPDPALRGGAIPAAAPGPDRVQVAIPPASSVSPVAPMSVNAGPSRPAPRPAAPPLPPPPVQAAPTAPPVGVRPRAFPESRLEMWPPVAGSPAYDAGAPQPGPSPDRVRREPARPPAAPPVDGLAPSNWSMERFREELME